MQTSLIALIEPEEWIPLGVLQESSSIRQSVDVMSGGVGRDHVNPKRRNAAPFC